MKKCDEIQKLIIDEFYGKEIDNKLHLLPWAAATTAINEHIKNCSECLEFKNKLYAASEKLSTLEEENLSMPSDFFSIINTAETIKVEKKKRIEIFFFVFAALGILIPFVGFGLYFGMNILLYMQIILYLNMPLVLIPLIINRKVKGVER